MFLCCTFQEKKKHYSQYVFDLIYVSIKIKHINNVDNSFNRQIFKIHIGFYLDIQTNSDQFDFEIYLIDFPSNKLNCKFH